MPCGFFAILVTGDFLLITNYPKVRVNIPLNSHSEWYKVISRAEFSLRAILWLIDPIYVRVLKSLDAISFYRLPLLQW
jgi:hypothetical protein